MCLFFIFFGVIYLRVKVLLKFVMMFVYFFKYKVINICLIDISNLMRFV